MKHLTFGIWVLMALIAVGTGSTAFAAKQECKATNKKDPNKKPPETPAETCAGKTPDPSGAKCTSIKKDKQACCCGAPEGGQPGGGDDKKGDDKKDDKKDDKGGGGGSPPQMPQMPQQQPEKKQPQEDLAAKEKARQARITTCKTAAQAKLDSMNKVQGNCEVEWQYDPAHPVADQKQKQDECKQTAIFQSQSDTQACDAQNPPGT